ncbi:MAG: hypothetical protein WAL98_04760, partial [Desulfatiglandaceae bacterium]
GGFSVSALCSYNTLHIPFAACVACEVVPLGRRSMARYSFLDQPELPNNSPAQTTGRFAVHLFVDSTKPLWLHLHRVQ